MNKGEQDERRSGLGEYRRAGDTHLASLKTEFRRVFFDVIAAKTPAVLQRLGDAVMPKYVALEEACRLKGLELCPLVSTLEGRPSLNLTPEYELAAAMVSGDLDNWDSRILPSLRALRSALIDWNGEFHLHAERRDPLWIIRAAVRTMRDWSHDSTPRKDLQWYLPVVWFQQNAFPEEQQLALIFPAFDPQYEWGNDFVQDVVRGARKAAREHIRELREHARELGMVRNQRPPDPGRVEWLVAFQIKGHSPDRIARDYRDPDAKQPRLSNTVFKAIQSEARKIDLALRPHHYRARETGPTSRQKIT